MTEEKDVKKEVQKEAKKEAKKEVQKEAKKIVPKNTVNRIKEQLEKGAKDVPTIATTVMEQYKKEGITKNNKGKDLKIENVKNLANAILRDIKTEKRGWWSKYKIEKDDKHVKIILK